MHLPTTRQTGTLVQRYKRFLADVSLANGELLTVHCPNSGSMLGCSQPGSPVVISYSDNMHRKYSWTLEMVQADGVWIGVNTALTNKIVQEGLENGNISDFGAITSITPEVRVTGESRLDFVLNRDEHPIYVEVKNCSLVRKGMAMFPDAMTSRGAKHLMVLAQLRRQGFRAAVLFLVQRGDATCFRAASEIDPHYAEMLSSVEAHGVEVLVYEAAVTPDAISVHGKIPWCR